MFAGTEFAAQTDAVDDVFQEVFQRLLAKGELAKLRDVDSLRKFLSVIAAHVAMDKIRILSRQQKRFNALSENEVMDAVAPLVVGGSALSREVSSIVSEILGDLPPRERACVEWHYFDGKTHRQISETLGLLEDTVNSILRRTREKLKKRLAKLGLDKDF